MRRPVPVSGAPYALRETGIVTGVNLASPTSQRGLLAAVAAGATLFLAACGSGMGGMDHGSSGMPSSMSPGMSMGDPKAGLASSEQGYTFDSSLSSLDAAGDTYRFRILGPGGKPQTSFAEDQTKLMHFLAVRADLTNYQHLHPEMAGDGTWSVQMPGLSSGPYRVYASFMARDSAGARHPLVLSRALTVPGTYQSTPLPAAADSTTVDGYTVSFQGQLMSGMAMPLKVHISKDGQPVTTLQSYLGMYAHLTAFRAGTMAFAHLHPAQGATDGKEGGPDLALHAELPAAGDYRIFLQFQTEGQLHTAALTVRATGMR